MGGLTAAGQITSYVMTKHARRRAVAGAAIEAAAHGVGVLAICPAAVETPLLDKGAVGGFVGRDYYLKGQGVKTAYDADRLARDTLRAIERNKALLVKPRRAHATWLFARLAPGLMQRMSDAVSSPVNATCKAGHRSTFPDRITPWPWTPSSPRRRSARWPSPPSSPSLFGAYFLRSYFILIVVAAVAAYLFTPLYRPAATGVSAPGLSATLTLLAALGTVIIPLSLLVAPRGRPDQQHGPKRLRLGGQDRPQRTRRQGAASSSTSLLARVPFLHDVNVTPELLRERMSTVAQNVGEYLLGLPAGRGGRADRRRDRGGSLPLRVHLAADQPRRRCDPDPPAQPAG